MIMLLFEIVIWLAVIMFTLFLVRGVRKIPVQYAKAVASAGKAVARLVWANVSTYR